MVLAPDGSMYLTNASNHRIRKISPSGRVTTLAGSSPIGSTFGSYADGPTQQAKFNQPIGVTLAADGMIYVADAFNDQVRRISPVDMLVSTVPVGRRGTWTEPAQWLDSVAPPGWPSLRMVPYTLPTTVITGSGKSSRSKMGKRNCPYGHFPANIVDQLLLRGHPCSIATNHQKMQRATSSLVARYRSGRDQYEFESLYGN